MGHQKCILVTFGNVLMLWRMFGVFWGPIWFLGFCLFADGPFSHTFFLLMAKGHGGVEYCFDDGGAQLAVPHGVGHIL